MENTTTTAVVTRTPAEKIIKNHVLVSMGFGALPIPFVDIAAITGTQISMISKLAKQHNVPFSKKAASSSLMALVGGLSSQTLATGTLGSSIKAIPFVGAIVGAVTYPAIAGATTYAVGQLFERHFAEGGNLFDFKPTAKKQEMAEELKKGEEEVAAIQKNK